MFKSWLLVISRGAAALMFDAIEVCQVSIDLIGDDLKFLTYGGITYIFL